MYMSEKPDRPDFGDTKIRPDFKVINFHSIIAFTEKMNVKIYNQPQIEKLAIVDLV